MKRVQPTRILYHVLYNLVPNGLLRVRLLLHGHSSTQQYWYFRESIKPQRRKYAYNEVLFIKGQDGAGKTAGALHYCQIYPSTLYFSFSNLDAELAPRIFAARYPAFFRDCKTWEDFFDQLYAYGIENRCTIFFDDAAARNDKDGFVAQLQRILDKNKGYSFFIVFLMKPWETLALPAKTETLLPMSPAALRRQMGLRDEDTFRLYTLTDGNPYLLEQYDRALSFEDNVRAWLAYGSRYYRFAMDRMEKCFRSPESYNTLMYGMATGLNRVSELSELSGFPMNKVDKYLKALETYGFIRRETAVGSRTRYFPAGNYLLLWYRFLFASGLSGDGHVPEETVAAFMDYLDNVLVPTTFRKTVLQWLDYNYSHYLHGTIDVQKPYQRDVVGDGVHFDYIYKDDQRESRYIVVKILDHLGDRCKRKDWRAIDDAVSSVATYYHSTLILASIHRFSDSCWQELSIQKNIKLIQIQTLNEVTFR